MMTPAPVRTGRTRTIETVHLLLAALVGVIIAVASQGWPSSSAACEVSAACDGVER